MEAGHMIAIDPPVRILTFSLASGGRPHMQHRPPRQSGKSVFLFGDTI